MGASGWHYKVPYDDDVDAALGRLRADVFASGEFFKAWQGDGGVPPEMLAEELGEMAEMVAEPIDPASLERLASGQDPLTIDEALMWAMDSGTHSILDIVRGVDAEPDFGVVTALSPNGYLERFGSDKPTESAVEAELDNLDLSIRERWQGIYVIAHTDDVPSSIYFVGVSGD